MDIGLIGVGNMAMALAKGLYEFNHNTIFHIIDPLPEKIHKFKSTFTYVKSYDLISSLLETNSLCFLAIKPQSFQEVSFQLKSYDGILISVMAGVSLKSIQDKAPQAKVIRIIPNINASIGETAIPYSRSKLNSLTDQEQSFVKNLFSSLGFAIELPEDKLDQATALSGSGPAFFAYIFKAFIESGISFGLTYEQSKQLCLQTAFGTAKILKDSHLTPDLLIEQVSSPGGTTMAGREVLESGEIKNIILQTLIHTKEKCETLRL